jgi:hypothetical protein
VWHSRAEEIKQSIEGAHQFLDAGSAPDPAAQAANPPRHVAMSWARRLKRVFGIEIEDCGRCGGACWWPGLPGKAG